MKIIMSLLSMIGLASNNSAAEDSKKMSINDAKEKIVVQVKLAEVGGTGGMVLTKEQSPVITEFVGDLIVMYAIDKGDRFEYIKNSDVELAGLTKDKLHEIATANIEKITIRVVPHGKIFAVLADGNYEAAMMLNRNLHKWINDNLNGQCYAVVAARDVFAVGAINDLDTVVELKQVVDRIKDTGDHLLSKILYKWDGKSWSKVDG